jgi:SAM-dependent methyltransferase
VPNIRAVQDEFASMPEGRLKTAALWDAEFRSGKYSFLHRPAEQKRLAEIAAMVSRAALQRGRVEVADVGCGEGLVLRHLDPRHVSRYIAIDISGVALKAIREERIPVARVRTGLGDWDGRPTPINPRIVIASEVLYYDPQAVTQMRKLIARMPGTAELIISCVAGKPDKPNWAAASLELWQQVRVAGWRRIEHRSIRDERSGLAWDVARYAV